MSIARLRAPSSGHGSIPARSRPRGHRHKRAVPRGAGTTALPAPRRGPTSRSPARGNTGGCPRGLPPQPHAPPPPRPAHPLAAARPPGRYLREISMGGPRRGGSRHRLPSGRGCAAPSRRAAAPLALRGAGGGGRARARGPAGRDGSGRGPRPSPAPVPPSRGWPGGTSVLEKRRFVPLQTGRAGGGFTRAAASPSSACTAYALVSNWEGVSLTGSDFPLFACAPNPSIRDVWHGQQRPEAPIPLSLTSFCEYPGALLKTRSFCCPDICKTMVLRRASGSALLLPRLAPCCLFS